MKQTLILCSSLLLLFTACSPKIGTMVTKTYPSLSADSPVTVYLYQTDVPSGTESLGKVSISDTGFSTNCDSATVMNHIKDEARKIGGNAVCITDHIKPSFWKSSCHQMTAIVLKTNDSGQPNNPDNTVKELAETQETTIKPTLSKFKMGVNTGYGWRGAKLSSNLQGDMRDFYKKLMSGTIWDGSFHFYFNDTYGIGLLYSSYHANGSIYAQMIESGETGTLTSKNTITFVGPIFAMRTATNDRKWILNLNLGMGYLGYFAKETFKNEYSKQNGATAGFYWGVGGECKFNKNWGIGIDFSMIGGILKEIGIDKNGTKSTHVYEDGSEEGLGQYRLTTGIRYYF